VANNPVSRRRPPRRSDGHRPLPGKSADEAREPTGSDEPKVPLWGSVLARTYLTKSGEDQIFPAKLISVRLLLMNRATKFGLPSAKDQDRGYVETVAITSVGLTLAAPEALGNKFGQAKLKVRKVIN